MIIKGFEPSWFESFYYLIFHGILSSDYYRLRKILNLIGGFTRIKRAIGIYNLEWKYRKNQLLTHLSDLD